MNSIYKCKYALSFRTNKIRVNYLKNTYSIIDFVLRVRYVEKSNSKVSIVRESRPGSVMVRFFQFYTVFMHKYEHKR